LEEVISRFKKEELRENVVKIKNNEGKRSNVIPVQRRKMSFSKAGIKILLNEVN
jgi:hypothetical protein